MIYTNIPQMAKTYFAKAFKVKAVGNYATLTDVVAAVRGRWPGGDVLGSVLPPLH